MMDSHVIKVNDEQENIYVIRDGFYSFEKGVDFRGIQNIIL